MDILLEISKILDANLDAETLSVCIQLCELGINPEALATVIKEIQTQASQLHTQNNQEAWLLHVFDRQFSK